MMRLVMNLLKAAKSFLHARMMLIVGFFSAFRKNRCSSLNVLFPVTLPQCHLAVPTQFAARTACLPHYPL